MTDKEFEAKCNKLGQLTDKISYYEQMLNEVFPGDWDYEYYSQNIAALSILAEELSKELWQEVIDRSPQD